jgi:NAD(P)-dependent dehydrogenase (short-subunit alcohol dehydrogenase family)
MDYVPLEEMELSRWRHTLDVSFDGVMLGMRAVIPQMKKSNTNTNTNNNTNNNNTSGGGGGSIMNFSSA